MLYLSHVAGGTILPYLYGFSIFLYILAGANCLQVNAIALSFKSALGLPTYIMGALFAACVIYVVLGGAHRILGASQKIVPIKVGLFCLSTLGNPYCQVGRDCPRLKIDRNKRIFSYGTCWWSFGLYYSTGTSNRHHKYCVCFRSWTWYCRYHVWRNKEQITRQGRHSIHA